MAIHIKSLKYSLLIASIAIFILNIFQGANTELSADEAYYWVYSQNLSWGYFDHPPMIALWVRVSDFFFDGELGVRFMSALSFFGIIFIIWNVIGNPEKKNYKWLYISIIFSTTLLNAYGFISSPDAPLMLFYALFLLGYKIYLDKKNTFSYFILTISIAGMFYSKYQSVLIIFFVFLSNLKLIRDYKLWLTLLGIIILYIPHLYWQLMNDFPSFRYHLFERSSVTNYHITDTLNHFVNAVVIFGLTFVTVYKCFFEKIKSNNTYFKALNFIVIGFFGFFLVSSFRGHVQAQWISPIIFPLLIITFSSLIENPRKIKFFVYLVSINICLLLFARFLLIQDEIIPLKSEFHGNKKWVTELKESTKGKDKMFINRYQEPSLYWFYADEKAHELRIYNGRKNQYQLIKDNLLFSSDSVVRIGRRSYKSTDFIIRSHDKDYLYIKTIESFNLLDKLNTEIELENKKHIFDSKGKNEISVNIHNPYNQNINTKDLIFSLILHNGIIDEMYEIGLSQSKKSIIPAKGKLIVKFYFDSKKLKKNYNLFGIGLKTSEYVEPIRISDFHNFAFKSILQ